MADYPYGFYLETPNKITASFYSNEYNFFEFAVTQIDISCGNSIKIYVNRRTDEYAIPETAIDMSLTRYDIRGQSTFTKHFTIEESQAKNLIIYALEEIMKMSMYESLYLNDVIKENRKGNIFAEDAISKWKDKLVVLPTIRRYVKSGAQYLSLSGLLYANIDINYPLDKADLNRLYSKYADKVIILTFSLIDIISQLKFLDDNHFPVFPDTMYPNR